MPLPAPCSSTKGIAATGPNIASNAAPVAKRAEIIGDRLRSSVNSTRRAVTCAGPTGKVNR
jgi:hypothetical protein